MMKRFFLLLLSLAFVGALTAETVENTVELTLKTAHVYPQGALLTSKGPVALKKGNSTVVIRQIGWQIAPSSIKVSLGKGASITSFEYNGSVKPKESARLKLIKDSLFQAQKQLQKQEGLLYTNEREVAFLDSGLVYQMRAQQTKPSNDMISSGLEFYHNKADGLHARLIATENAMAQLKKTIALLEQKIKAESRRESHSFEVSVHIHAPHAVTAPLTLSYFTSMASWEMEYQATVERTKDHINLLAQANVTQYTGQDWKDVHVVCSNFEPSLRTQVPRFTPWRLGYVSRDPDAPIRIRGLSSVESAKNYDSTSNLEAEDLFIQKNKALHVEFTIDRPYTIVSGDRSQKIDLQDYTIESKFSYVCVPRLETKVYLMATLKNWEQYHLLSGKVNLNLDGQFVGQTYLNTSTTDSLALSIGADNSIVVERTLEDKLSSKRIIGKNKRVILVYLNQFKNTLDHDINVVVMDQIPVPTDQSIRVEWSDFSSKPDEYIEKEGKLIYNLTVPKHQTKNVKVGYEITCAKHKTLNL